jgi:hypothetical protein
MDPAQLKAQYDQTQYLSSEHNNISRDLLKGFDATQIEFLKSQNAQSGDIKDAAERTNFAAEWRQNNGFNRTNQNVQDKAAGITDTIYRTSADTTAWVNKNGADNLAATERVGGNIDTDLYRVAGQLDNSIYRSATDNKKDITDGHQILSQQGYSIAQQQQNIGARDHNELISYFRQNADQNWSNFSKLSLQAAVDAKDSALVAASTAKDIAYNAATTAKDIAYTAAQTQMEILKSKGDLSKQSAFEYSSLKQSIAESEGSIKDLLRAQESDRLRDVLRATEHKSLYFELRDRHHHRRHRH